MHAERRGVCRDFAHLAVTLCRCMNIPARYCTGYLGDIGVPPDDTPMDFSAWFEVYLSGRWYTVRCPPQQAAHRAHPDGARPRRRRRAALDQLRAHRCSAASRFIPTRWSRPERRATPADDGGISFATVRPDRPAARTGHRSGRTLVKLASLFAGIFALLAGPARGRRLSQPSDPCLHHLERRRHQRHLHARVERRAAQAASASR